MRVVVITKDETDYARRVTEFMHDFQRQTGRSLESMNPETPDGIGFCQAYDIVEYPSIIALADDGHMLNLWRGLPLPTISEVSFYA